MARTLPGRWFVAGAALAALAPAPALAQGSPPPLPGDAAVSQYREALPTSSGSVALSSGAARVTALPSAVQATLEAQGGAAAPLLEKVATSAALGAPQRTQPTPPQARGRAAGDVLPAASLSRGARAAADAATTAPERLFVLAALLIGVALAIAAAAAKGTRSAG